MVELESPITNVADFLPPQSMKLDERSVDIRQQRFESIVEVAAWSDSFETVQALIESHTDIKTDSPGIEANGTGFVIAPNRILLFRQKEGLYELLGEHIGSEQGSVIDLSHGRFGLEIEGTSAIWVLSKLFSIDFESIPIGHGISTAHHEAFAQIQRTDEFRFVLFVFRSFARSFAASLCKAAWDVGYRFK